MVDAEIPTPAPVVSETLLSMLTPAWRRQVEIALKERPELFGLTEKELRKALIKLEAGPTYLENMIRLHFWREYDICANKGFVQITQSNVYAGAVNEQLFHRLMKYAEKVAWMLCPIANYDMRLKEALCVSTEQLRDVLEMPHVDAKGKINTTLLVLKMRIHQMLDVKLHGMAVQRIEQRNLNVSVGSTKELTNLDDMNYLRTRLSELEGHKKKLDRLPAPAPLTKDEDDITDAITV